MVINGTSTADTLNGTLADDQINGLGGNDILNGNGGNDTINGGLGNNTYLFGKGDGKDVLVSYSDTTFGKLNTIQFKAGVSVSEVTAARTGSDLVLTVAGTDSILVQNFFNQSDPGNQFNPLQQVKFSDGTIWNLNTITTKAFVGSANADTIVGTISGDTIDGRAGNDAINGGFGNNTYLFGKGDGKDVLVSYSDTTFGKLNTLEFKTGVSVSDVAASRSGADLLLTISATDAITIQNFFNQNNPGNQFNPLQQIKFADGTIWSLDTIVAHSLTGGTFTGTSGDDIMTGTLQADHFFGGLGDDTYFVNNVGDAVTESSTLATEMDTVNSSVSFTLGSNIENLTLTGVGAINGTGNNLENLMIGNSAANVLDGKAGADVMIGGGGNDTYIVDNAGDLVIETSSVSTQIDTVMSALSYGLGTNVENLTLTGTAAVNGTGNSASNVLTGNSGANTLDGGAGNDTLSGLVGNDKLLGDIGNDRLVGGAGNDTLTGGTGLDKFVFNTPLSSATNVDSITDFATGDLIILGKTVFTTLAGANVALDPTQFFSGAGATAAADASDVL
jgi:Ca2+-binding RTX toxin-like protein